MVAWIIAGLALAAVAVLGWLLISTRAQILAAREEVASNHSILAQQTSKAALFRDAIFKTVDDVLLILDADLRVLYANPTAGTVLGPNTVGETLIAAVRQPELEVLMHDAQKIRGEGVERRIKYEGRIFHARAIVIQHDSQQMGALTLRDVTEMQRLERARREMVSNITHELGTPITNITLLSETVLSLPVKQKHKRVRKLVKDIQRESETLTHLVQEIRDLSLIESGQMPVRLMPTDLRLVVEDSVMQLQALAEGKHQTIINTVPPITFVLADDLKLQRAIKNIVHNAMKFSDPNEDIHISAQKINDEVVLAIQDSGPGIPADELPRIFERFYQVDPARRVGTGLGLAIVRHIVLAHGGRTWAESVEGEGATFYIALVAADLEVYSGNNGPLSAP